MTGSMAATLVLALALISPADAVDASTGESVLVAEDMPGAASIAFGQGDFDAEAIYVTSTRTGRVWEVQVGAKGAPLHH